MPSPKFRFAGETAFLILVALGLALAGFDPVVIGVLMFVVWVLVALLERASSKQAARAAEAAGREPSPEPPPVEVEPVPVPAAAEPEREAEPPLGPTVSKRGARAILASAPPPLPREPAKPAKPARRRLVRRTPSPPPSPPPEPEPVTASAGPAREWNLWELQRAVRDAADDSRHDEWVALLIHLREFANADGDLPIEFDRLVRESFGPILEPEPEPAAAS